MDGKHTCLCDTMKCNMKDVMWNDAYVVANDKNEWENACLCVEEFDNGMV